MQQRTTQVLYAYWNDVRGDRIAPRRFDIEPSQLGTVLAETLILECDTAETATFRLAGTKICDNFGREFRGTPFLDLFTTAGRQIVAEQLTDVLVQGAVLRLEMETVVDATRRARFEVLLLPLVHSGAAISRILGAVSAIEPPPWLGTERLPPLDVLRFEQIWPEGRPHAVAAKFRNQAPLTEELSGARLVRINRRSFRVLDGGLGKN